MDYKLIYSGEATLEDMMDLYKKRGVTFVLEDGKVTEVIEDGSRENF